MKEEYREAFSEVNQILDMMPSGLLDKIPNGFKVIIRENKSNNYNPNIKEPFENCKLKEETHIILALIYRDFLCNEQEKKELLIRDAKRVQEFEDELREKYNPDNIFKNRTKRINNSNNMNNDCMAMVEVKEKKFLQKIFEKIKNLFIRKKY